MVSATSSLNSASSLALADRIFRGLDSDSNGKVTENELAQALSTDTKDPVSAKQAAKEILQLLDNGNKGYLTEQDLETAVQQAQTSQGSAKTTTRPPPGGGGGPGKAEKDSAAEDTTPTATLSMDPRDTNGDGSVSTREEMAYYEKQYVQQVESAPQQPARFLAYG